MIKCIGNDPACPCQDGDACHYRDIPGSPGWPVKEEPNMTQTTADDEEEDGRFLLFCKDDLERPEEHRWCGVVVERHPVERHGEVLDLFMHPSEEGLKLWFNGWVSGWRSAEFHKAARESANGN